MPRELCAQSRGDAPVLVADLLRIPGQMADLAFSLCTGQQRLRHQLLFGI